MTYIRDDFILEALRTTFGIDSLNSFKNEVSDVLWHNDMHSVVKKALPTFLNNATQAVLATDNHRTAELRHILTKTDKESYPPTKVDLLSTKRTLSQQFTSGISVLMEKEIEPWQKRYRMQQMEGRHSLSIRVFAAICAALVMYPLSVYRLISARRQDKEVAEQFKKSHGS